MKKINPFLLSTALIAAVVVFPMSISAISLGDLENLNLSQTTTNTENSTTSNTSSSTDNTEATTSTDASLDLGLSSGLNIDDGSMFDLDTDSSAVVNVDQGSTINVDRDSLKDKIGTNTSAVSITSNNVATEEDLRTFASNSLMVDQNLKAMEFTNSSVEVAYQSKGKLLAIFPMKINVVARVNASGEVTIDYPWYHFLLTDTEDDQALRASMENEIKPMIRPNAEADSAMTVSQEAAIAARVHSLFRNNFGDGASTNVTTDTNLNLNSNGSAY